MIVLDASVLIGFFDARDLHHRAAVDIVLAHSPGELWLHPVTLAEVVVGGVRVGRGAELRDAVRRAGIGVAASTGDEPLRLAELRVTTSLKLPDCCVLHLAVERSAALATFDRAVADAARACGLTVVGDQQRP